MQERREQVIKLQQEWNARRSNWQAVYSLEFPTFDSTQAIWYMAALSAPATLVSWMNESTGPHCILNHLRDPILADLTQHWPQELIVTELKTLQYATEDVALRRFSRTGTVESTGPQLFP